MNTPSKYYADDIPDRIENEVRINGRWVAARPRGMPGLFLLWRLECAWMVLTGKADVLLWRGQQ